MLGTVFHSLLSEIFFPPFLFIFLLLSPRDHSVAPSNHFPFFPPFCAESPLFHQTFPLSLRCRRHQSPQVKSVGWAGRRAFVRTHAERKKGPWRRRMASRVGNFSRGRAKESPNIFELFHATIPFLGNSCQILIVRKAIHKNKFFTVRFRFMYNDEEEWKILFPSQNLFSCTKASFLLQGLVSTVLEMG